MKLQQLISAGFAITALAAATVPALGWTLLGDVVVERPAVSAQASWEAEPLLLADATLHRVVMQPRKDPSDSAATPPTPW